MSILHPRRNPSTIAPHYILHIPCSFSVAQLPMADVWTCCKCKNLNLNAHAPDRCSVCQHYRDATCTTGPPPTSSALLYKNIYPLPYMPNHTMANYDYTISVPASYAARGSNYTAGSGMQEWSDPGGYGLPNRPNMAGWWVCHCCNQTNNPQLAPEKCSVCGHTRNSCCYTYSRM